MAVKINKILEAGIGYTIGNIVLKGVNFLTIPLFTYLMSTGDFGKFNVYLSYESTLFVVMGFAIHTSIKNAKYDFEKTYQSYLSNCIYLICLSFCLFVILGNLFSNVIINVLGIDKFILNCLLVHSFSTAIITFYTDKVALDYEYKKYIQLSFISTSANILLSLFFLVYTYRDNRYWGRTLGSCLSALIIALYIIIYFLRHHLVKINFKYWYYALKISLPIIPHGLSQIILSSFDRIMIDRLVGASQAGIYSITFTVGTILQVLFTSIDKVWTPWFFEKMAVQDRESIKKRASDMLMLTSFLASSLILVSPEIITFLAPETYWEGKKIVMIVLLGIYFSLIYTFPATVEYFYKKTGYIAVGTIVAAVMNIILNTIFISKFGYMAASYTTVITYFIYFMFHLLLSIKLSEECLFDKKMGGILIFSTCFITAISRIFLDVIIVRLSIFVLLIGIGIRIILKKTR